MAGTSIQLGARRPSSVSFLAVALKGPPNPVDFVHLLRQYIRSTEQVGIMPMESTESLNLRAMKLT